MSFMVFLMAIMGFWGFYGLSVLGGGGQEMYLVPESRLSWSGGFGRAAFLPNRNRGLVIQELVPLCINFLVWSRGLSC